MLPDAPTLSSEEPDDEPWKEPDPAYLDRLDAWVARAEGLTVVKRESKEGEQFLIVTAAGEQPVPPYTKSEALARPIIEREGINIEPYIDFGVPYTALATIDRPDVEVMPCGGYTELEAAMLCYVSLKFGDLSISEISPAQS